MRSTPNNQLTIALLQAYKTIILLAVILNKELTICI